MGARVGSGQLATQPLMMMMMMGTGMGMGRGTQEKT